jgi:hypothetical protein
VVTTVVEFCFANLGNRFKDISGAHFKGRSGKWRDE